MGRKMLNPLNSGVSRHTINAFDIETTGDNAEFYMGSIVGDSTKGNSPEIYWGKQEMLDALISYRFRGGYIYAHNLEYDLMGIMDKDFLESKGYDTEIFHNGSNIIYGKVRDNNKNLWEFRDSLNLAPRFSVKDMGEIVGLEKMDMDFENSDVSNYEDEYVKKYNIRDSRICYRFLKWFQNQLNQLGGNMHITAAKTAMKFYRRNYLQTTIEQPHKDVLTTLYNGYYGGRTSPFTHGKIEGPIYAYDIASLYPYAMKQQSFPNTNRLRYDRGNDKHTNETRRKRIWEKEGMSKVTVKTPDIHKPVLPKKTHDKLLFPTGTFTGWQSHNELRFALERGYVIEEIHQQIWTVESINLFHDYVDDLFDKRLTYKQNNNATESVVKLLMNSLYGKFGQRIEDTDGGIYKPLNEQKIEDLEGKTVLDKWVIEEPDDGYVPNFVNPLIAAYVTSRGRMELYRWIERVEREGGDVFYTDTDSIYTDTKLSISDDKTLGDMDYEGRFTKMWVFGPKFYVTQTPEDTFKITAKGVPHSEMDKMWEELRKGNTKIEYDKIAGMRESIRRGYKPNEVIDQQRTVNLEKATKRDREEYANILKERVNTNPKNVHLIEENEDEKQHGENRELAGGFMG